MQKNVVRKRLPWKVIRKMNAHIDFKVAAVLPAGGVGQRTGLEVPKQVSYIHHNLMLLHYLPTLLISSHIRALKTKL